MAIKIKGIKEVNPIKDLGAWEQVKKFHKTGLGKAAIYGGLAGLAIKIGLGYGLYKAGQASGRKQPKKYMAG
jgi:hypothetical protein